MKQIIKSGPWERFSRFCAFAMIALYCGALLIYDLREETLELPIYALAAVGSIWAGHVLVSGIKHYKAGNRRTGLLYMTAAVLLLLAGRLWNLGGLSLSVLLPQLILYLKYILAIFWPFALLKAVKVCGYGLNADKYSHVFTGSALYVLFVFCGLWILEDLMIPWDWKDADWMLTELVILAGFSLLVFIREYIWKLKGTGPKLLGLGTVAGANLAGFILLVAKSPRLRVILYSLGVRLLDRSGSLRDVNWLQYRMDALRANWSGNLEPGANRISHYLEDGYVWLTWRKNPLTCLNASYGTAVLLLFLLLFAAMIFFAGRIFYREEETARTAWYIRAELIIAAVFAMLNELFLVRAGAGVGNYFPLLGYGVQMFPLLSILYRLDELGEAEPCRPTWKRSYMLAVLCLLAGVSLWRISTAPFQMDGYAAAGNRYSVPEDTYSYGAWTDGTASYFGKRVQGMLEGYAGTRDGDRYYFGNHTKGARDGYGLQKEGDGSLWMGRYEGGTMAGGIWIYADGSWEMTEPDQKEAVVRYDYGDYYCGTVTDGKPDGYGRYYSPKQEYFYIGQFRNGMMDGRGAFYYGIGATHVSFMEGIWEKGAFFGKGVLAADPEAGFEEGEWASAKGADEPARLTDGSLFYRGDIDPRGLHIIYRADGDWYCYNAVTQ